MARAKKTDIIEEKLTGPNIEKVIEYLKEKNATKKQACHMLNIAYNTTRLDKIIETHLAKLEYDAKRRAEKRGKPATQEEINFIISEYLDGIPVTKISESIYRGVTFIHTILDEYAVPIRQASQSYFKPNIVPEEAARTEFEIGEKVYSVRYDCLATVRTLVEKKDSLGQKVYGLYLHGDWMQYAYQPAYELASLEKLKNLGIKL